MPINHLVLNGIIRKDLVLSLLLPFLILDNSIAIRNMKTFIPAEHWPRLCFAESYQFVVVSSASKRESLRSPHSSCPTGSFAQSFLTLQSLWAIAMVA